MPSHFDVLSIHQTLHKLEDVLSAAQRSSKFLSPFHAAIQKIDAVVSGRPTSPPPFKPLEGVMQPEHMKDAEQKRAAFPSSDNDGSTRDLNGA